MPYYVETKEVSLSKWYNPKTWGKTKTLWRRKWDMNTRLRPGETKLFIEDQLYWDWKDGDESDYTR